MFGAFRRIIIAIATQYIVAAATLLFFAGPASADSNRDLTIRGNISYSGNRGTLAAAADHAPIVVEARHPVRGKVAEGRVDAAGSYSFLIDRKDVSTELKLTIRHPIIVSRPDVRPIADIAALNRQARYQLKADISVAKREDAFVLEMERIEKALPMAIANRDTKAIASDLCEVERDLVPAQRQEEFKARAIQLMGEGTHSIATTTRNAPIPDSWLDRLVDFSDEPWLAGLSLPRQARLFSSTGRALSAASRLLEDDDELGRFSRNGIEHLQLSIANDWRSLMKGGSDRVASAPYFDLVRISAKKRQFQTCRETAVSYLERANISVWSISETQRTNLVRMLANISRCIGEETRARDHVESEYIRIVATDTPWKEAWRRYGIVLEQYQAFFTNGKADLSKQLERDLAIWRRVKASLSDLD